MNIPEMVAELRALADKLEAGVSRVKPSARPTDPTLGFIYDMIGAGRAPDTPERDANLAAADAAYAAQFFTGLFPVGTLTTADKAYLARVADTYKHRTGRDIMRDGIVSGSHHELNAARQEGEAWRNNYSDAEANVGIRAAVESKLGR